MSARSSTCISLIPGVTSFGTWGEILFTLPNVKRTTVTNKRNWNYDKVIIKATVLPKEEQLVADEEVGYDEERDYDDEVDVDEGQKRLDPKGTHVGEKPIPPLPFNPPFTHQTGRSFSSLTYMPLTPSSSNPSSPSKWRFRVFEKDILVYMMTSIVSLDARTLLERELPFSRDFFTAKRSENRNRFNVRRNRP